MPRNAVRPYADTAVRIDHRDIAQCGIGGSLAINSITIRNDLIDPLIRIVEGQTDHSTTTLHIQERSSGTIGDFRITQRTGLGKDDGPVLGTIKLIGVLPITLKHTARENSDRVRHQVMTAWEKDHAATHIATRIQCALNGIGAVCNAMWVGTKRCIGSDDIGYDNVLLIIFAWTKHN